MKIRTKYTNNPSWNILNEFFLTSASSTTKGLSFQKYKSLLANCIENIINSEGISYNEDESGLLIYLLSEKLKKYLKKLRLKENIGLKYSMTRLMRGKRFRKMFYVATALIFSLDHTMIGKFLGIKCCLSANHHYFCKGKWEELLEFTQISIPKMLNLNPVTSISLVFDTKKDPTSFFLSL